MARSKATFSKKEKEKKKQKRKKEKQERKEQRKAERAEEGAKSFEDMLVYQDEFGNISTTPPDPNKKRATVKAEDIVLGIPKKDEVFEDPIHKGRVKFFNDEKGYGFLVDNLTGDSIFVHINNCEEPLEQNDRVTFEIEMGPKGPNAINVRLAN